VNIICIILYHFYAIKITLLRKIVFIIIRKIDFKDRSYTRKIMKRYYNIEIGKYTYGFEKLDGSIASGTKIGSFCSIAPGTRIGGMNHPSYFVSTHPFLYYKNRGFVSDNIQQIEDEGNKPVIINDDVWIGQNAIILPGLTIGKGAIIGAGAVVTRDIEPYSIAVGVPAKIVTKRFSDEVISNLTKINWCSWSEEVIKRELKEFYNVETFIKKFSN
jgi:virginiamycin A acetyltransferase